MAEGADIQPAACPGNAGEPLPSPAEMTAVADRLAALDSVCHDDVGYLAYRGAVLLRLLQSEAAAAMLERALLIFPGHAGAQADYAQALALLGDTRGARALVDSLLKRADVPLGVRIQLQDWHERFDRELASAGWQAGGSIALRVGAETNLNSAPTRSSLDLTSTDGTITLPLADSYRAKGGGATLMEASFQAGRNLGAEGRLQFLADIRGRHAPGISATDYQQYEFLGVATLLANNAGAKNALAANQFSLGVSRLDYGGERLYEAERLGVARIFQAGSCLAGGSLDAETRRYPAASNLDGMFAGVGASLRCPVGEGRVSFLGRLGQDRATRSDRPGGDQLRWDLRLSYTRPLAGGRLDAELSLGRQMDGAGYSELLASGERRRLTRFGLRSEWAIPLAKSLEGLVAVEGARQGSNIPLFDIDSAAFWVGARWTWAN